MSQPQLVPSQFLADGLVFGESPRYHDGKLYVSDMTGRNIWVIDPSLGSSSNDNKEVLVHVENQPNGMGFDNQGGLIYSSQFDGKLFKYQGGEHSLYADLSDIMQGYCGDMVIDRVGRVYLDDSGARILHGEEPRPGRILLVEPEGRTTRVVADDLAFPNALVISNDGRTLFAAETFGQGLMAFDIDEESGGLERRRHVWSPSTISNETGWTSTGHLIGIDGGCMDAEGGLWLGMLGLEKFIRLGPDGFITHEIATEGHATACTLGGKDGRSLYLVTNWLPHDGQGMLQAMVEKRSKCTVSVARVAVGKGEARP